MRLTFIALFLLAVLPFLVAAQPPRRHRQRGAKVSALIDHFEKLAEQSRLARERGPGPRARPLG